MESVLDNPAWNALISGNTQLSAGNEHIKYFPKEVAPFVGLKQNTAENFEILYRLFPSDRPAIIISKKELSVPSCWTLISRLDGLQMVYQKPIQLLSKNPAIVPLQPEQVPQMLALTKLTNPGPFSVRTIEFGNYEGIFEEDRLVAMAGHRLRCFEYVEISAVCTHPDFTGKGYARQLLLSQIYFIQSRSSIPFLHVRSDNYRAIKVYEDLGFQIRTPISFYFLRKNP